jgi:hypothetical protein
MSSPVVPDQPKGKAAKPAAPKIPDESTPGGGFLDTLLTGLANAPHAAAHGILDAIRSATGTPAGAPSVIDKILPQVQNTPAGNEFMAGQRAAYAPVTDLLSTGLHSADAALGTASPTGQAVVHQALRGLNDAAAVVPAIPGATAGAEALGGVLDQLPSAAAGAAESAATSVGKQAGFRTAADHPIAAGVAGSSGHDALTLHNQQIGNTLSHADAGVPHDSPLNPTSLEAANEAPNSVYARAAQSLPTGPLDQQAAAGIGAAGQPAGGRITAGSPQAQPQTDALKSQLLDPQRQFTGDQVINEMRGLRQEGYKNVASDDVSNQQLGSAQLDMARAIEGHVGRNLPQNGTVSLPQFQDARTALAKNYAVQGAMQGSNVSMPAIARMSRQDPDLLTGGLKVIGDFANEHPGVTGLANRIEVPPSFANDVGKASGGNLESLLSPSFWSRIAGGQAGARRVLTGDTAEAVQGARSQFPGRLGDEFGPLQPGPLALQPPPGSVGNAPVQRPLTLPPGDGRVSPTGGGLTAGPPSAPPTAPGAPQGSIPLADLLSHGVEQSPPPGLSAGPMGSPAPQGIPFSQNVEHAAGGLEVSPGDWLNHFLENNSDVAGVRSQGVPEGIMTRTPSKPKGTQQTVDFPSGTETPSRAANNASGESAASLEAINRGTKNLVRYSGEGMPEPVMRDVTQADRSPGRGEVIINADTGQIADRGNLSALQARGLLARWKALHGATPLGQEFATP